MTAGEVVFTAEARRRGEERKKEKGKSKTGEEPRALTTIRPQLYPLPYPLASTFYLFTFTFFLSAQNPMML